MNTERYRATTIRPVLLAQDRTVSWLGRKLGTSREWVRQIAEGDVTVNHATAARIALILGVPLEIVFAPVATPYAVAESAEAVG